LRTGARHGPARVEAALTVLEEATAGLAAAAPPERRSGEFKALRKGLEYCSSVAAAPETARPTFEALVERAAASGDRDLLWVARENVRKRRLEQLDTDWVAALSERLGLEATHKRGRSQVVHRPRVGWPGGAAAYGSRRVARRSAAHHLARAPDDLRRYLCGPIRSTAVGRPGCWLLVARVASSVSKSVFREAVMASTATPPRRSCISAAPTRSLAAHPASARRHLAWLLGGIAVGFLVPFVVADQLGLQRDLYLIVYVVAVVGLFLGWARDTGQSLRAMFPRRWQLAVGLGVVFAGIGALIATGAEDGAPHPGGVEFIGALVWRGIIYGAADGLLLSAFPILIVFAALKNSGLRRRVGGLIAVGAIAMVASLAMTAVYHAGYSDFRGSKLRKPVTGDLLWSVPVLATLNPVGAPLAHVGVHATAIVHNYDADLFLPPH